MIWLPQRITRLISGNGIQNGNSQPSKSRFSVKSAALKKIRLRGRRSKKGKYSPNFAKRSKRELIIGFGLVIAGCGLLPVNAIQNWWWGVGINAFTIGAGAWEMYVDGKNWTIGMIQEDVGKRKEI